MKIIIGNKDRTTEFGPVLKAGADARMADKEHEQLPWSLHALSLRDAKNEPEFLDRWAELSRKKSNVALRLNMPKPPGLASQLIWYARGFLWRLLRYQHDRIAFRQNLVNSQVSATLEFQHDEIRRLRARIDEIENRGGKS